MVKLILILKYYDLERILNLKENFDPLIMYKSIERDFLLFKASNGHFNFVLSKLIILRARNINW